MLSNAPSAASVAVMLCGVVIAAFSQLLLKRSAGIPHAGFWKQYLNWRVVLGYCMLLVSTLFSIRAYAGMDYKFGPAIESVGFVLVIVLSCALLRERLTRKKLIGSVMIVGGLLLFCV